MTWNITDLEDMVRLYTETDGKSKDKRDAVLATRRVPWATVEAELKARGIIATRDRRGLHVA